MTHLSRPATGLLPRLTHRLGTTCRSARLVTRATLLCLAIGAAPAAHAQSIQGLFASDAREQGGRPVAVTPRKDWRNTLDRQEREGEGGNNKRDERGQAFTVTSVPSREKRGEKPMVVEHCKGRAITGSSPSQCWRRLSSS